MRKREKDLILNRLGATIEMISSIKDKNFEYQTYVKSAENRCGTVCCVAGWYPKYFPKSNLEWFIDDGYFKTLDLIVKNDEYGEVAEQLERYHKLPDPIIGFLFYGLEMVFSLTKKGSDVKSSISNLWRKSVQISAFNTKYPNYSEEDDYSNYLVVSMKGDLQSTRTQVKNGFEFIYYLIDNDYIDINNTYNSSDYVY